ncbi:MAG: winged helix-turn-helix transcriptional regulator [Labilithrix sp.]|nr:winged helix-turn-helix transcriptional regulator [Labilithrix sp.]
MRRDRLAALAASALVFAALGDEQRLRLVSRLCHDGPLSIARLTEGTKVTRQAVTKHLRVLEAAGLARGERSGRETVWTLDPRSLDAAREHLAQISQQWDLAIERLRAFVEDDD